jgi:hypothetical protein
MAHIVSFHYYHQDINNFQSACQSIWHKGLTHKTVARKLLMNEKEEVWGLMCLFLAQILEMVYDLLEFLKEYW